MILLLKRLFTLGDKDNVVQRFCPLEIKITQFPDGFHLKQ